MWPLQNPNIKPKFRKRKFRGLGLIKYSVTHVKSEDILGTPACGRNVLFPNSGTAKCALCRTNDQARIQASAQEGVFSLYNTPPELTTYEEKNPITGPPLGKISLRKTALRLLLHPPIQMHPGVWTAAHIWNRPDK